MTNNQLKRQLFQVLVPPPDQHTKQRATDAALRALHEAEHTGSSIEIPARRGILIYWRPALAFAAALVAIMSGTLYISSHFLPRDDWQTEKILLSEFHQLFQGRLKAIVAKNGDIEPVLSDKGQTWNTQPLVVSFQRDDRTVRVISFSGQILRIALNGDDVMLDTLITADGKAIVVIGDFVHHGGSMGIYRGYRVQTQPLEVAL